MEIVPVTITLEQLKALKACQRILNSLVATYGTSVTFNTPEELQQAVIYSGESDWCSQHLLTPKNKDAYDAATKPLWDTYLAARKPLWDIYEAATRSLLETHQATRKTLLDTYEAAKISPWDIYEAAEKPLLDTYEAARKPLWDTYEAAEKPLMDTYKANRALIFATLYFEQYKK